MKTALWIFAGLFLLQLNAIAQGTFNQFNCNSYGNYSDCTASDNTRISCYNGSYSECRVEHPNGFVTSGPGPGAVLINWLVERHRQHVTDKAIDNAFATVLLTIRHSMHLMDLSAFTAALTPYVLAQGSDAREILAMPLIWGVLLWRRRTRSVHHIKDECKTRSRSERISASVSAR